MCMIVDKIQNLGKYFSKYPQVVERLQEMDEKGVESEGITIEWLGDHKIIVETKETFHNKTLESHQIMSDIHCVLQGEEEILVYSIDDVQTTHGYNLQKDVTLYSSDKQPLSTIKVKKGWFVYFEPGEIHSPWNPVGGPPADHASYSICNCHPLPDYIETIQKVVVKLNESI